MIGDILHEPKTLRDPQTSTGSVVGGRLRGVTSARSGFRAAEEQGGSLSYSPAVKILRSRLCILLAAVVVASSLTGCSDEPAEPAPAGTAATPTGPGAPLPVKSKRVGLLRKDEIGAKDLRTLTVEEDGTWKCQLCPGEPDTVEGELAEPDLVRLHQLLADPALPEETDHVRGYRLPCSNGSLTTLMAPPVTVTFTNCSAESVPAVSSDIASLLAKATPFDVPEVSTAA